MVFKTIDAGSIPASLVLCFFIMTFRNFFVLTTPSSSLTYFLFFLKYFFSLKSQPKSYKFLVKNSVTTKSFFEVMSFHFFLDKNIKIINNFNFIDKIIIYLLFASENTVNFFNTKLRLNTRLAQSDLGLYSEISLNKTNTFVTYFLVGLKSLWLGLRFWVLSLVIGLGIFYALMVFKFVPLLKISFQWLCIVMFLYWIMTGFVFFIKKYQTSKYTTVIQRFWRRTYIIFWLIETSVFITFLYVTFNASQEPFYMHDQIKVFKTHLFSWRYLLIKVVSVAILLILSYCLLLFLKWNIYTKQSILFFFVTLFLTYVVWLEFYQFFHIISYYGGLFWTFDSEERMWILENDFKRTRLVNNYVALCLMAKFWHLIFIYVFWVFFILRTNELQRYRYPLLSANLQNFVILYIFCWLTMYPWLKFYARKYMDYTYYWFFTNAREIGVRVFFNDIKLFFFGFFNRFIYSFNSVYNFNSLNFFYWIDSSFNIGFDGYRKHFIKNNFLNVYYSNIF